MPSRSLRSPLSAWDTSRPNRRGFRLRQRLRRAQPCRYLPQLLTSSTSGSQLRLSLLLLTQSCRLREVICQDRLFIRRIRQLVLQAKLQVHSNLLRQDWANLIKWSSTSRTSCLKGYRVSVTTAKCSSKARTSRYSCRRVAIEAVSSVASQRTAASGRLWLSVAI